MSRRSLEETIKPKKGAVRMKNITLETIYKKVTDLQRDKRSKRVRS
jgi:hypothetical protein